MAVWRGRACPHESAVDQIRAPSRSCIGRTAQLFWSIELHIAREWSPDRRIIHSACLPRGCPVALLLSRTKATRCDTFYGFPCLTAHSDRQYFQRRSFLSHRPNKVESSLVMRELQAGNSRLEIFTNFPVVSIAGVILYLRW